MSARPGIVMIVQTVSLSWQHCGELAVVLTAAGAAATLSPDRRVRAVGAFAREVAVVAVLYALWQLAGRLARAPSSTTDALARARWIQRAEHRFRLPSEHSTQHLILGHRPGRRGREPVLRRDASDDSWARS